MPLRPLNREQAWLLPPTLGELIPNDHPARFVAEFVDALDHAAWVELGIGPEGEPLGAPAYHPRALLSVWLHGFMTGIRSSRKLEAACRDQMSYLWLTGWQHPDHNTLWRFYQAHRQAMRKLLKYTVATAVKLNLTDEDAQLMKGRDGIITGYNAQAMVSPLDQDTAKGNGMLITAAEVANSAADSGQFVPMLEQAEELIGQRVPVTLADGGYHTVASLEAGERRGQILVMAERYQGEVQGPYFKDQFAYDAATDSYICPHGQRLPFRSLRKSPLTGSRSIRVYRASRTTCRTCPAFGVCTRDKHAGRALWVSSSDMLLRKHRQWMQTDEARSLYSHRKELIEAVFGILKDQLGARRFLLRGLANVRAEFTLMAAAFNLRTLWRVWNRVRKTAQLG
jgi:transposase